MRNKNRLVAPVIEKTVDESSDNHNEVDNKKRQTSNLIQKITSIIFCIISFGYGIGERGSEIQIEIVKHIIMNSNTRFYCMEFTYTNISKMCFSTTFSFTSITYLQEMNEATEVPTRNTGINKKFQLLELHLQIHVERGTYTDRLTCLLQIIIELLLHLIIILIYKSIFRKLLKNRYLKDYSYLSNSPPPSPLRPFPPCGSRQSSVLVPPRYCRQYASYHFRRTEYRFSP